jgi:hypothetical protein
MFDFASMNSALQKSLTKIGRSNGASPPDSQDPMDRLLHYYFIDKTAAKFFEAQADASKSMLLAEGGVPLEEKIAEILKATIKNQRGESSIIAQGQYYALSYTTRKPASRLNTTKLRNKLMLEYGLKADQLDKLFEECSDTGNPTQIFAVQSVK